MSNKKIFCIIGETASGKDMIVKTLVKSNPDKFRAVCSYATRPKRDNEIEGNEHYFVSTEKFNEIRNTNEKDIIAYTKIENNNGEGYEYMALKDELDKSNIYIIDPRGLFDLKENVSGEYDIISIYIFAPFSQRKERSMKNRSDFEKEFNKRVEAEHKQFSEFYENKLYDYVVYNFDGFSEYSVKLVEEIINHEINVKEDGINELKVFNEKYSKEDLKEALVCLKNISNYYGGTFKNSKAISRKVRKMFIITRNLILEKLK